MVYIVGFCGLLFGFFFGQMVLAHMLRGYSKQEIVALMKDMGQRTRYGLLNWIFALGWAACFVYVYRVYFS